MAPEVHTAALILAGGASRRVGRNKAFLEVGGSAIIERQIAVLRELFDEVAVSVRERAPYKALGLPLLEDAPGKGGALNGILAGLEWTGGAGIFVVACDMPLLNPRLIRRLANLADGTNVVVPRTDGGLEPLHAFYSKACIEPIRRQLAAGDLKIVRFFPQVQVRVVDPEDWRQFDPEGRSFLNVYVLEDLERAEALLDKG